jgi:hypothetical protein
MEARNGPGTVESLRYWKKKNKKPEIDNVAISHDEVDKVPIFSYRRLLEARVGVEERRRVG